MKTINMKVENKKAAVFRNEKGSAIAYALVIIVMISILLSSMVQFIVNNSKSAYQTQSKEEAFQIAEAGVNFYRWYLAHETDGRTAMQIRDFWQGTSPDPYGLRNNSPYERDYVDAQGGVLGKYSIETSAPDPSSTIVYVAVTGWTSKYPAIKRTINVRFRRPSWSEDSVLANDFMRFGEGTTVNGKIHSNSGIRFDGIATNVVSSSLSTYDDPDHTGGSEFGVHTHVNAPPASGINDNQRPSEAPPSVVSPRIDVFKAGRDFPTPQVDFASVVSDISFMRSQATVKFDNSGAGRRIILKADGNFNSCKVNSYSVYNPIGYTGSSGITDYNGVITGASGSYASTNGLSCVTVDCCDAGSCSLIQASKPSKGKCISITSGVIPNGGIIFVANNLWLEGTISGKKVSFVAAELSDEPGYTGGNKNVFLGMNNLRYTNHDGNDIIGVIAQEDVEVIKDSLNDLFIDGALLAKGGRVGRYYYGNSKNSITVNGSIATYARYGFAYTDGTGYQTRNLDFDNNLLYFPPPYFPTGTQYSIDSWEED